ncbi:CheR family methyltransferase [Azospira inquinata]
MPYMPAATNASVAITDQEFALFQRLIYKLAGIHLSDAKKVLLVGRLSRRLKALDLSTFSEYYRLLTGDEQPEEMQRMVDLLTTNETYFFREPKHFEYLRDKILPGTPLQPPFRVWSAACSSGEEPYTLSMVLAEYRQGPWEVFASDISTVVLEKARNGHYPLERHEGIPATFLNKYCLKGVRSQAGTFLVAKELRDRVHFRQINLTHPIPAEIGEFQVIFLRNVMIYFDTETKQKVIDNLLPRLKSGGYFIIGHSESLNGVTDKLRPVQPTIYRKP